MLLRASAFARCQTALLPKRCAVSACSRQTAPFGDNRNRLCFVAPEESATRHLAALLAQELRAGDCYCLHGDVGAGKSAFRWLFCARLLYNAHLCTGRLQYLCDDYAVGDSSELLLKMMSCPCLLPAIFYSKFTTTIQVCVGHSRCLLISCPCSLCLRCRATNSSLRLL